jgi:hypothetical protein
MSVEGTIRGLYEQLNNLQIFVRKLALVRFIDRASMLKLALQTSSDADSEVVKKQIQLLSEIQEMTTKLLFGTAEMEISELEKRVSALIPGFDKDVFKMLFAVV